MKYLMIIAALMTASFANAADLPTEAWGYHKGLPTVQNQTLRDSGGSHVTVEISENYEEFYIIFNTGHGACLYEGFDDFKRNTVITVNGQRVRVLTKCTGKEHAIIYPETKAGFDYIIDEFTEKNFVHVEFNKSFKQTYSAKGFTALLIEYFAANTAI